MHVCISFIALFFSLLLFFKKTFIVIQLQLYAFSPHPSTPPQLNPPPSPSSTLPLDFVHVSFIVVPVLYCIVKEASILFQHRKLYEHTETLMFYKGTENKRRKKQLCKAYGPETEHSGICVIPCLPCGSESISTLIGGCNVVSWLIFFLTKPCHHHFFHSKLAHVLISIPRCGWVCWGFRWWFYHHSSFVPWCGSDEITWERCVQCPGM